MCEIATKVIIGLQATLWHFHKETVHFVYFRHASSGNTYAVCKRTGYATRYPNVD